MQHLNKHTCNICVKPIQYLDQHTCNMRPKNIDKTYLWAVGQGTSVEEIRMGRRKQGQPASAGVSDGRPSEWGLFCLRSTPGKPRPNAESRTDVLTRALSIKKIDNTKNPNSTPYLLINATGPKKPYEATHPRYLALCRTAAHQLLAGNHQAWAWPPKFKRRRPAMKWIKRPITWPVVH
jgi:hypothetical protein